MTRHDRLPPITLKSTAAHAAERSGSSAAQIIPLLYGNARQTVFENERDQANRRDLCLFVEAEFEERASVPRCNTRRAIEDEIAE